MTRLNPFSSSIRIIKRSNATETTIKVLEWHGFVVGKDFESKSKPSEEEAGPNPGFVACYLKLCTDPVYNIIKSDDAVRSVARQDAMDNYFEIL